MKLNQLFLLGLAGLIFSCSSSDDADNGNNKGSQSGITTFEIPLKTTNYWVYDVDNGGTTSRDSLYIVGDVIINSKTYKEFKTKEQPTGFYSSSLNNNAVRTEGDKLLLNGDLGIGNLPIDLDLSLDNFIIFKANAAEGTQLDSKSSSFQQEINSIPVTVNYTLKTVAGENLNQFTTPNNDVFSNVKKVKIILSLSATATISGFSVPVLSTQDVLVSDQYIANNIGVVYAETVYSYSVNATVATTFSIPESVTQNQTEILDTYLVE